MNQSLTSPLPLDNQLNSSKNEYEEMRNEVYTLTTNGDTCDNTKELEHFQDEIRDKFIFKEEASLTPNNSRKFSPDKIKGNFS